MSPQPQPEATPATTAAPLDWQAAAGVAQAKRSARKRVVFENYDGQGRPLVFTVRQLTQEERDRISEAAVEIGGRGRTRDVRIKQRDVKVETLRCGIVEGPTGFAVTETNIALLDPDVVDELVDAIDGFSRLEDEHRVAFRGLR